MRIVHTSYRFGPTLAICAVGLSLSSCSGASSVPETVLSDENPLRLERVGDHRLRVIAPEILELTLVTTKKPDPARVEAWDFVEGNSRLKAPPASEFLVRAGDEEVGVKSVGFRRRPIYAPLRERDLRIGSHLYLELMKPVSDGQTVEVRNPSGKLWPPEKKFMADANPLRISPAIHVNQEGYVPQFPKRAMIGYYLGSKGELNVPESSGFQLIDAHSGKSVFEGRLFPRRDAGFTYARRPYQAVLEADFSEFKIPGEYRLQVPGLGASFPFWIDDGIAALFARTYARGLYHQRCGAANELPFTRHTHEACHTAKAEIPITAFKTVNFVLEQETGNYSANKRHVAPRMAKIDDGLYPLVNTGKIDVAGGHHDAGDYSKYTINSAQLIHALVFAADAFPGVGELDNLGLPESGDGKSDLLQIAKWEADFLAKMQDADGGFYFLVYPRDRRYEHDVLPDKGDPQIVFPKTTSATAATVAALAQAASSPLFKAQFPEEAALYLSKAKKGWEFLQGAIARHGRDGAYQKITHYGDEFMHDDELAWAAAELFLATGDKAFEKELIAHFDPTTRESKKWTWWRLFESYGCAIRSYAFAARTKRLPASDLDAKFLALCEDEIISWASELVHFGRQNAYGTTFPEPNKRFRNAGWFFPMDMAFDLAVASQLEFPALKDPRPRFLDTILGNLNYEAGCNPVNVSYITGLGWRRPREMVHHYAQNDRRILPPSGLVLGSIQEGFPYLEPYQKELGTLSFPPDWDELDPYPFYDRWGDTFNTSTEFVVPNLARSLACAAFLMAQTPLQSQPWRGVSASLLQEGAGSPDLLRLKLEAPGVDLSRARFVWEAEGQEPLISRTNGMHLAGGKRGWVEVEATLPDGRRVIGVLDPR